MPKERRSCFFFKCFIGAIYYAFRTNTNIRCSSTVRVLIFFLWMFLEPKKKLVKEKILFVLSKIGLRVHKFEIFFFVKFALNFCS